MTMPRPEPADVREARRAAQALRLALSDAEGLASTLRQRYKAAEDRVDLLIQMHEGQPELPVEET